MIYLIKSYVNGDLGVSDHIVEKADSVMGAYDTADDAIRFLKNLQLTKKLQEESTVNELIEVTVNDSEKL
jgi:hypothetical protein